jgi:hypothetical protein
MWRPPARREYWPKPMDPGQRITWTVTIPGRWERPGYMDGDVYHGPTGKWIEAVKYDREGTIWADGPSGSTWWVTPDDEPVNPVVVRRQGKKFSCEHREGELFETREWSSWRDGIRCAENVRCRGVFAVVHETLAKTSGWGWGERREEKIVRWHADPDCPEAAGKPRDDGTGLAYGRTGPNYGPWDTLTIADVLVGRVHLASEPPFGKHCIMLGVPAEPARELVPA